ncbi:MAG: DNA topoisomerase III [Burkholderiales bacterium]|nr:DNA topoisomerase III [Burkholderiales bacterium]
MTKKLIIAEKPSVANDIARALGKFTRHGDYYESDEHVLSSAIGHLLEIAAPEQYEVKRGKWSFAHLPVIPPHFDLRPIERTEDRLKLLTRLIKRKDVTALVNACDAGREGELIFRYILQHAGARKPVQRLWLQSMTQSAIREGFRALRRDEEMLALADAAKCRSEADWLVGINGTRAMTAFNSKEGGFYLTTVGRVQTPTLAILVEREQRIRAFVARDYWELHARFGARAGEYAGRWFDEGFAKDESDPEKRAERIWDEAKARAIAAACEGRTGTVSEQSRPATQLSPLLFDLTSLQREANGKFGFSARTTLSLAQSLYEKHKALTYPRTDARALPEDYPGTVREVLAFLAQSAAGKRAAAAGPYGAFAARILKEGWVRPNKRIFDNSKISDHFAIVPTAQAPGHLNEAEAKIYDLVVRRFLAVFYPAAEFLQTTRITRVHTQPFKTEGRVLVTPGWLAVYGRTAQEESESLPAVQEGERVGLVELRVEAIQTKPPARFTEATLLSAMEGAGKLVEDEDLREAMDRKGLGTPATRAAIIEGLIREEYVHRNNRELVPTPKAFSLLFALRHFGVDELTSPELTGDWEYKLKQMEQGRLARDEFMDHITTLTRELVNRIRDGDIPDTAFATVLAPCPKCGGTVQENYRKFQCQSCDFSLWKVLSGREWSPEELGELLQKRKIGPLTGFRSRAGRPFVAAIQLGADDRIEFDFGQERTGASGEIEAPDFSGRQPVGPCPKCASQVFDMDMAYACEKALGPGKTCDFRTGKVILQRPIEREQIQKLLAGGRTDLLHRFISKKGRPFSAFLVRGADGKVGFEFAPRAPRKSAAAAAGAAPASRAQTEVSAAREDAAAQTAAPAAKKPVARKARAAGPEPGRARGASARKSGEVPGTTRASSRGAGPAPRNKNSSAGRDAPRRKRKG